jgi:hypothetical protein
VEANLLSNQDWKGDVAQPTFSFEGARGTADSYYCFEWLPAKEAINLQGWFHGADVLHHTTPLTGDHIVWWLPLQEWASLAGPKAT